jgi:hypothetical protein
MNEEQIISVQQFTSDRLTVKQKVYRLVQRFPYLKDDYNKLILWFWRYYDNSEKIFNSNGMAEFNKIHTLTPAESITRAFRELVENGRIKLEFNTADVRSEFEIKYHHYYAVRKIENL